jgi:hypothetical protein
VGAAVLAGCLGFLAASSTGAGASGGQDQLIPLYSTSASDWTTACSQSNGAGQGSFIIANVNSGPGSVPSATWANLIDGCAQYARTRVIGYVWTNYGQVSLASVESQVDAWYAYYPGQIAGIFYDGVSDYVPGTQVSNRSYYQTLAAYVRSQYGSGSEVVYNFGANPGSDWMFRGTAAQNANLIVTFEGSYNTSGQNPFTRWSQAGWEASYPASDFAALIYNASSAKRTPQPWSACKALASWNLGYVDVTVSYSALPSYYTTFTGYAINGQC